MATAWILFAVSFMLSLGLTPLFRKVAVRTGFIDSPTSQLKKHTAPVPYLGGLAVYFAFLLVLQGSQVFAPTPDSAKLNAVLAGGTVVLLLGLLDDLFSYTAPPKFAVQTVAALLLALFGVRLEFTAHEWAAWSLTVLWVVAVTNALNLVDILDGLAGGLTVIACLGFLLVPLSGEHAYVNVVAAALGGAVLGFLPFNVQPARIYLGDTGALFCGFVLAAVAMGQEYTARHPVALAAPLLILAVPLYDTLLVMALRRLKGRSMFMGSDDHAALRLRATGLTVRATVGLLWAAAALSALAAGLLVRLPEKRALALLLVLFAAALVITLYLARIPVDEGYRRGWGTGKPVVRLPAGARRAGKPGRR